MPEVPLSNAIIGGLFIAVGASLLLLFNGRIAGVGGALSNVVTGNAGENGWRAYFLVGIILGGGAAAVLTPDLFDVSQLDRSSPLIIASGVIMGFGGRMSNGCTSGHGICGIARLSVRSLAATATFFGVTLLSMYLFRHVLSLY